MTYRNWKEHCTMKTRQIPARLLPSFVVSGKSLNSSFTHCKMRLYHLPYEFPMFVFVRIKDKAKYHAFIDIIFTT